MRIVLALGLIVGSMVHADQNCEIRARSSAERFVAAYVPTLRPRLIQDLKIAYGARGLPLNENQIELQDSPVELDAGDAIAISWSWPRVLVHFADHTETLFAPLNNSLRLAVQINAGCQVSGRIGEGYLQVHYYDLNNFTPVFADTFLDTPAFHLDSADF